MGRRNKQSSVVILAVTSVDPLLCKQSADCAPVEID